MAGDDAVIWLHACRNRPTPPPHRKRSWKSFSLRSLFVITLVIACLLGWKVHKVQRQRLPSVRLSKPAARFITEAIHRLDSAAGTKRTVRLRHRGCLIGRDVEDVSYLADLPTIEDLNLSGTKVYDLSPLAGLTRLKRLLLLATPVRDISPLSDLTELESLSLENTQVADVTPLAKLVNLHDLSLAGNCRQ